MINCITFVIGNYQNGGVAIHSTNIANHFSKSGYKCNILCLGRISNDKYIKLENNVRIISIDDYDQSKNKIVLRDKKTQVMKLNILKKMQNVIKFNSKIKNKVDSKIRAIRLGEKLRPYCLLHPNDVYICFGIPYYEPCYFACLGLNAKIIYAEKNASQLEFPPCGERLTRKLEIVKKADSAVLQTQDELDFFGENICEKAVVIHNPIKEGLPEPYSGKREKIIVNFCRINEQKNLPLLIDSFYILHRKYPEYRLLIYGNTVTEHEKDLLKEYNEYIKSKNLSEAVTILPPCADVHSKILKASMFVSSSDFEGLSNSMIEAMAIGLPCVCTDCLGGGATEMISDGENGLLVPCNDAIALSNAMVRIIENSDFSEICGKNAAKIRKEMNSDLICNKWLEVINSL